MPMTVGDVVKVGFASWMFGQLGLNIRYYRVVAVGASQPSMQEVAQNFKTVFDGLYADLLVDDAEFLGCAVRNISPSPGEASFASTGAPVAGLETGDPMPSQVSGIITLQTGLSGRDHRGRIYVPFPSTTVNTPGDDRPSLAYISTLDSLGAEMIATQFITVGGASVDLKPLIFSPTNPLAQSSVVGFVSRRAWATQRRRGNYGSANPEAVPSV